MTLQTLNKASLIQSLPKGSVVALKTAKFTSVTSVTMDNIFSNDFKYYRIVKNFLGNNTDGNAISFRLRANGVTNSSSNYTYQYVYAYSASIGAGQGTATNFDFGYAASTTPNIGVFELSNPFQPTYATWHAQYNNSRPSTSTPEVSITNGGMTVTTSYDGFIIEGTTMTGTITVYGYR